MVNKNLESRVLRHTTKDHAVCRTYKSVKFRPFACIFPKFVKLGFHLLHFFRPVFMKRKLYVYIVQLLLGNNSLLPHCFYVRRYASTGFQSSVRVFGTGLPGIEFRLCRFHSVASQRVFVFHLLQFVTHGIPIVIRLEYFHEFVKAHGRMLLIESGYPSIYFRTHTQFLFFESF